MTYWKFRSIDPDDNSGTSTVEDNFANEETTSVEILVRETLQNPLDARHSDEIVEVHYNLVSVKRHDSVFANELFSEECRKHLFAGKLIEKDELPDVIQFLVVEDFGTSGLEGCYTDSSVDGSSENWNAFWFREGEGAKPTKSNGGAGQGKITLYTTSEIRTVLALTHRVSDGAELLFGCCRFRQNYKISGSSERWAKEGRWGSTNVAGELCAPIEDVAFLTQLKTELSLKRANRPGTTFIVPLPVNMTLESIKQAVVNEFYFPIRRGRLKINVGEVAIDSTSITKLATELGSAGRHASQFRSFLESVVQSHIDCLPIAKAKSGWTRENKLSDSCFESDALNKLRESLNKCTNLA